MLTQEMNFMSEKSESLPKVKMLELKPIRTQLSSALNWPPPHIFGTGGGITVLTPPKLNISGLSFWRRLRLALYLSFTTQVVLVKFMELYGIDPKNFQILLDDTRKYLSFQNSTQYADLTKK